MTPRRILLVDCDQFFVQCARMADPDGAGREPLLLVGGSPAGRGVVTSASYETRAWGVRSGMPTGRALRLCPGAKVVPVPRRLCVEKSRAVREVLVRFSPAVEPASIDEAYIDLTGTERLYRGETTVDTARRILVAVHAETGIRVSIGGGATKLVAKVAADRAKPNGVHIVEPGAEIAFLKDFALADLPGVGPIFAERLRRLGLVRIEDAQARDAETLEAWLGPGRGRWLYDRVRGIDAGRVETDRDAKSVSREETFASDLSDDADLETELLALAIRLGADLRADGLSARTVTVKLRDADFTTRTASTTHARGIASDRALFVTGRELLRRLRARRRVPARLIGIAAAGFDAAPEAQLALFEESGPASVETERDRRLARAADDVRARFGPDAVRPARLVGRPAGPRRGDAPPGRRGG